MYQHVIAHLGPHLKSQQIAQLAMASTSDCSTQLVILSPDSIFGGPTDLRHCCIKILADLNCSPLVFNLRFQYPQGSGSVCFMNNIIIQICAGATPYLPRQGGALVEYNWIKNMRCIIAIKNQDRSFLPTRVCVPIQRQSLNLI